MTSITEWDRIPSRRGIIGLMTVPRTASGPRLDDPRCAEDTARRSSRDGARARRSVCERARRGRHRPPPSTAVSARTAVGDVSFAPDPGRRRSGLSQVGAERPLSARPRPACLGRCLPGQGRREGRFLILYGPAGIAPRPRAPALGYRARAGRGVAYVSAAAPGREGLFTAGHAGQRHRTWPVFAPTGRCATRPPDGAQRWLHLETVRPWRQETIA